MIVTWATLGEPKNPGVFTLPSGQTVLVREHDLGFSGYEIRETVRQENGSYVQEIAWDVCLEPNHDTEPKTDWKIVCPVPSRLRRAKVEL